MLHLHLHLLLPLNLLQLLLLLLHLLHLLLMLLLLLLLRLLRLLLRGLLRLLWHHRAVRPHLCRGCWVGGRATCGLGVRDQLAAVVLAQLEHLLPPGEG